MSGENIEVRKVAVSLSIEKRGENDPPVIVGTPIVYGKRSEDLGFFEINEKGAAAKAIEKSDARALYGHNSESLLPLGRQSAGTLRMVDRDHGVDVEINPPDTQFARDLEKSIRRGDLGEMSYAFRVAPGGDRWERKEGAEYRYISEIDEIFDVSIVAFAAFNDTKVAMRGLELFKSAQTGGTEDGQTAAGVEIEQEQNANTITIMEIEQ